MPHKEILNTPSSEDFSQEVKREVGIVQIADDVIAVIAEIAALEVDGMKSVGTLKQELMQTITGKKLAKGVRVDIGDVEGEVSIAITGVVNYGARIKDVCLEIQEKVKNSIETMTGLKVTNVDVHVVGVAFDTEETQVN